MGTSLFGLLGWKLAFGKSLGFYLVGMLRRIFFDAFKKHIHETQTKSLHKRSSTMRVAYNRKSYLFLKGYN